MFPEIEQFKKHLWRQSPHTSTYRHYTSDLRLFFAWVDKLPTAITMGDVDAYITHCQEQGHPIATINRRLTALRSFYQFLENEIESPPANPVIPRRHFVHQRRTLPRDVTDDTLDRLFAVITVPRDKAIFLLMLRCGLRVGEIRQLSLIDLGLQPPPGQLPRLWVKGKGGKQRVVYLSLQALTALNEWLIVRPNSPDMAVFLNRFGHRLNVTGIQKRLAHYCRQAGIWLTCHQLRHTFGRHLTEAQVPVTTTQRLLGHAQLRTTQIYTHLSNRQAQAEFDAAMVQITGWFEAQTLKVCETFRVSQPAGVLL
ncbi:MAG: tyrosine-type recombinase/integrase [Anaerolineales bacterium]|nr:tyrosine-type recombinase/integrase [Anaerolineales bacterium]